ncbi:hypothetical protein E4U21_002255 [Claviceps maximensis]|nr:hypothetical protein E4U21_002255 [Claviceps maximensis]
MPPQDICPHGYQFYSCHSNDFNGCCSVNPCSLPDCPRSFIPDGSLEDVKASSSDTGSPTATMTSISTPPPPPPPSSKTDSGITHTIPNNSVVTVTRHTVVFSEAPPPTESSSSVTGDGHTTSTKAAVSTASTTPCASCTPTPASTSPLPSSDSLGEGGLPSGAIAGVATGGAVAVIILLILVFVSRNRKKQRGKYDASETETLGYNDTRMNNGSEKSNPVAVDAGHLRPSSDPFAPFGGRADQPEELHRHRPPSGTFEMDGAGISAVELPAMSILEAPDTARTESASAPTSLEDRPGTAPAPATDPAATLASRSSNPQGGITYVNQWNQYKAMAAEESFE